VKLVRWLTLACALLVPFLQRGIDARLGAFRAQEEILYVWSGDHLRRMFPGFETVLADIYWLRTIQYYGGQRAFATNKRYDLLEPLTRITVTLDPKFDIAYRYGATFLAESYPLGAGNPAAAVALLRLGVEKNPDAWQIWQNLGVFQYFFLKDAKGAAAALALARERPGAPEWLATLAASFLRKEGDRNAARDIWKSLYAQSENGAMRENALVNLQRLDALDVIEELNRRVSRYRAATGELPRGWEDLARARLVGRQPVDPSGTPFDYDPEKGVFAIGRKSGLWFAQ
jgi:hypothetical protein